MPCRCIALKKVAVAGKGNLADCACDAFVAGDSLNQAFDLHFFFASPAVTPSVRRETLVMSDFVEDGLVG